MATLASIKTTLTFGPTIFGSGKTVRDAQIARMKAWFESEYATQLDGASVTADDFGHWMWRQVAAKVRNYEERAREAANTQPETGELTS